MLDNHPATRKYLYLGALIFLLVLLAGCGGTSYRSANDVYDYPTGITYEYACDMGVNDACAGMYGGKYYSDSRYRKRYARAPRNVPFNARTYSAYATKSPTIRQRLTKMRTQASARVKARKVVKSAPSKSYSAPARKTSGFGSTAKSRVTSRKR